MDERELIRELPRYSSLEGVVSAIYRLAESQLLAVDYSNTSSRSSLY